MPVRSADLNLLPKEVWEKGLAGLLLKWVLSIGRHVVIFTELIVIGAFLFRFGLDRTLTDLHTSIKAKQAAISGYGDLEANFRRLQTKLETIKGVHNNLLVENVLTVLSQIIPADAALTSLTVNQEQVVIEGYVATQNGLAALLQQAQNVDIFNDVILENVESTPGQLGNIEFTMTLSLKSS